LSRVIQKKVNFCFANILGDGETFSSLRNIYAMCFIGIIAINWLANYLFFNDFGLYVDDYFRIPSMMQAMIEGHKAVVSTIFSSPINVRPLHGDLIYALSLIGLKLGGIPGVYLIAFLVLSINSILTFILLIHVTKNIVCSFIGALAPLLNPVITAKLWLTAALGIQPALTLLLLSFIFYIHKKKVLSYVLVATSLFCYETFFWVFISAPLLVGRWSRKLISQVVMHVAILSSIFTAFFIFKSLASDPRLGIYNIKDLFHTAFKHSIEGPYTNLAGNFKIPIKTLISLSSMDLFLGVFCAAGLFLYLYKLESIDAAYAHTGGHFKGSITADGSTTSFTISIISRLLLVGLIMLIFSYPLTFLGSVRTIYGIDSRLHFSGTLGISFIYAGIGALIMRYFSDINKSKIGFAILSVWLSLLIVYNFGVQQDYRQARNIQRKFWTDLIKLCPDITDGTLVFFYPDGIHRVKSISSFDWSTSFVLEKLYDFPAEWGNPPRVYVINKAGWENILFSDPNLTLSDLDEKRMVNIVNKSDIGRKIDTNNCIFIDYENGYLHRLKRRFGLNGKTIQKDTTENILGNLKKGVLFSYLVNE